jgi:hypothetical protein
MSDIFISYKKEDAGRVVRIVEALRADGFSVWWDHGIAPGAQWDRTIQHQLDVAKVVIAVWSVQSRDAPWVKEESAVGKNRGILVPIRIDDVEPPLGFSLIQASDLIGWDGDVKDPRWTHFVGAVRSVLTGEKPQGFDAPLRRRPRTIPVWFWLAGGVMAASVAAALGFALLRPPAPAPLAEAPIATTAPGGTLPSTATPSVSTPSVSIPSVSTPSVSAPGMAARPAPAAGPVSAQEQAMFDKALAEKSRGAWQSFLASYPNSPNAQRARDALMLCRNETREVWKPPIVPINQPVRGVGTVPDNGATETQACNAAKAMARATAKRVCDGVVTNMPARNRNARLTVADADCMCNDTGPNAKVCVVDMQSNCVWETLTPETGETCG